MVRREGSAAERGGSGKFWRGADEGVGERAAAVFDTYAGSMRACAARRAREDANLFALAQDAVLAVADQLLAEKGVVSVDELSRTAQEGLRATAKRLVVAELVLLSGMSRYEAHAMVGLALTPTGVSRVVERAMRRGEARWDLVRRFWESARGDTIEVGLQVADALFGTDPATAAAERLDTDGQSLHGRPWMRAEFDVALERELTRFRDPEAERRRARGVHERRRAWIEAHSDGSVTFAANGPLTTWIGVHARIDRAARRLRAEGDARTLDQLRHDLIAVLLQHGTLAFPGGPDGGEGPAGDRPVGSDGEELATVDLRPEEVRALADMLSAQGPVALQVIVPLSDLVGPTPATTARVNAAYDPEFVPGQEPDPGRPGPEAEESPPDGTPPDPGGGRPAGLPGNRPGAASFRPPRPGLGEIVGRTPAFLQPWAVRQFALAPGTTLFRLLVDPADGRCVERTITRYLPDADMRRQVVAADVYSRAPGSRVPATQGDIDHVEAWIEGSDLTTEHNLQSLDRATHLLKTAGRWSAAIGDGRDVTWTTLLGQVVTTRPHDYRQYLSDEDATFLPTEERSLRADAEQLAADLAASFAEAGSEWDWLVAQLSKDEARTHACRVLYGVLLARGPGAFLALPEDEDPDDATHDGWMSVRSVERAQWAAGRAHRRQQERAHQGWVDRPPAPTSTWSTDPSAPPPF